ncbi:MAG: DNA repair protein RecO [Desulfosarcina sp.]|nr:DNA repair protein RecO [Desulfosarcina sp.]MBC2742699.1 DNA repair protein RecO [Desulfosarcina sp.]MBC2765609.1 DNA repair protein RecO [Desulfosarcina sp.]
MTTLSTSAILLRRIEFGDYDLIVSLFTLTQGKTSAIAKSAKKSVKRFPGVLEPFSRLNVVLAKGRGKGMPVLQEASLEDPFFRIREDIIKTAYASYWAELIYLWMAEGEPQAPLYRLTSHVLAELNRGETPVEALSILFQMRFLSLAGFRPNFDHCHACKTCLDQIRHASVVSDPSKGGIACPTCGSPTNGRLTISKGTLKQLIWTDTGDLERAARVRFTPTAISEGLKFLETFVPFHIGKSPKSLKVLRAIRHSINGRKNHDAA